MMRSQYCPPSQEEKTADTSESMFNQSFATFHSKLSVFLMHSVKRLGEPTLYKVHLSIFIDYGRGRREGGRGRGEGTERGRGEGRERGKEGMGGGRGGGGKVGEVGEGRGDWREGGSKVSKPCT